MAILQKSLKTKSLLFFCFFLCFNYTPICCGSWVDITPNIPYEEYEFNDLKFLPNKDGCVAGKQQLGNWNQIIFLRKSNNWIDITPKEKLTKNRYPNDIVALDFLDLNTIWFVGNNTVMNYNNNKWWTININMKEENQYPELLGITAINQNKIWAIGCAYKNQNDVQPVILKITNKNYSYLIGPDMAVNDCIKMDSNNLIWGLGNYNMIIKNNELLVYNYSGYCIKAVQFFSNNSGIAIANNSDCKSMAILKYINGVWYFYKVFATGEYEKLTSMSFFNESEGYILCEKPRYQKSFYLWHLKDGEIEEETFPESDLSGAQVTKIFFISDSLKWFIGIKDKKGVIYEYQE